MRIIGFIQLKQCYFTQNFVRKSQVQKLSIHNVSQEISLLTIISLHLEITNNSKMSLVQKIMNPTG